MKQNKVLVVLVSLKGLLRRGRFFCHHSANFSRLITQDFQVFLTVPRKSPPLEITLLLLNVRYYT